MLESFLTKLHNFIEDFAPSPETVMRREALAVQGACCDLLMEVARLDSANAEQKRNLVAQALWEQFGLSDQDARSMIESAGRAENHLTSYYEPVTRINDHLDPQKKARFIEQLWRVAMVDGDIDMYEDHLVRKLAELLYVPHSDFILAKNRVRSSVKVQAN